MKKLMFAAAIAAMTFGLTAEEAKPEATAPAPAAAEAKPAKPARPQFDRAKFEERMKERKAAVKARAVEVLKKYGLDDAKADACYEELQQALRPPRPDRVKRPPKAPKGEKGAAPAAPTPVK